MNRMFKIALSLVFTGVFAVSALAQDSMYPDVPENHWAYDAIARLRKDNIIVPGLVPGETGKYLGRCYLTRYEFAVYTDRLYRVVTGKFSDLQSQIDALKGQSGGEKFDPSGLQAQIDALKAEVAGMKGWGDDVKNLQRLVNEFSKELNGLDLNVTEMKKSLSDLDSRVSALEKKKSAFDITGQADLAILGGHSQDGEYGLLHDGSIIGYNRKSTGGGNVGMSKDVTVLHQLALNIATTGNDGPKVKARLLVGNTLDTLGAYSVTRNNNLAPFSNFDDAATDVYFEELNATWNASLVGQGVSATVGRFGWQSGKYIARRSAYTHQYYMDEGRDSGNLYLDGIALGFGFGQGSATAMFGRNSNTRSTNGLEVNEIRLGPNVAGPGNAMADSTMGVALNFPIGEVGKINLAYLQHESLGAIAGGAFFAGTANRVHNFGVDASFKFNNVDFGAAYSKASLKDSGTTKLDNDNAAWDVNAKFALGGAKIGAGYRRVERNFAGVATATGRFGTYWAPRNFEGFNVNASFNPSQDVTIWGKGEFVKGVAAPGLFATPLTGTGDKIDSFMVGANFKANVFDVGLSYEDVKFKVAAGDAKEKWYTLGLGYAMGANSKLAIKYIVSDSDLGVLNGFLNPGVPAGGPSVGGKFKGGLLATQLTVKF